MSSQAFASDMFQENAAYQHAGILLYDPVAGSRQATRGILFNLGFREIVMVNSLDEFEKQLETDNHDLVIADITDQVVEVASIVHRVRRSDLGNNPFLVVILTSFELDAGGLSMALNSGADDLVMRPLSTGQIQRRVKSLVKSRKDFIVASDYIGPDRRSDPNRPSNADLVKVPNSLKDRVEKGPGSAAKTAVQVATMREQVAEEHLHRLAVRLGVEAHCYTASELGSDEALNSRKALDTLASDIRSRLGPEHVQANSLLDMLSNVLAGTQRVHPDKQVELIFQLALGVSVTLAKDGDEAAMEAEVDATVAHLNERLGRTNPAEEPESSTPSAA